MLLAQSPVSPCDVCSSCTRLMRTGMRLNGTPRGVQPRRLISEDTPPPDENNPPPSTILSPNKFTLSGRFSRSRTPLEDHDPNSQDSGYAVSEDSKSPAGFRFAEPCGFAPRRSSNMESPRRRNLAASFAMSDSSNLSSNSMDSTDDGFMDQFQSDNMDEDAQMPAGLGNLISGRILSRVEEEMDSDFEERSVKRRILSCENKSCEGGTPVRRCYSSVEEYRLKRPPGRQSALTELSRKRHKTQAQPLVESKQDNIKKGTLFEFGFTRLSPCANVLSPLTPVLRPPRPLVHSASDSDMSIKLALQRSTQEDLIGDFSRPFALPLMPGKHQDLKAISSETLGKLIDGDFDHRINSYKIIDCRYPYEYEGGHIKGSINLYTQDQIKKELIDNRKPAQAAVSSDPADKRDILVFHCEFSSERGPKLSRYLRKEDRAENRYPWLHYPELYLLHGGYQTFFDTHSDMCEPKAYKPMHHPAHSTEMKHFRAKSKSWAGSNKKMSIRSLSRLGF